MYDDILIYFLFKWIRLIKKSIIKRIFNIFEIPYTYYLLSSISTYHSLNISVMYLFTIIISSIYFYINDMNKKL